MQATAQGWMSKARQGDLSKAIELYIESRRICLPPQMMKDFACVAPVYGIMRLALENPADLTLWDGLSETFAQALGSLILTERVRVVRVSENLYLNAGFARPRFGNWLPAALLSRAEFRNLCPASD